MTLQTRAPGSTTWLSAGTMATGHDIGHLHEDPDADRRHPGPGRVQDADRRRAHRRHVVGRHDRRRGVPDALPVVDRGVAMSSADGQARRRGGGHPGRRCAVGCLACGSASPSEPAPTGPASPIASVGRVEPSASPPATPRIGDPPVAVAPVEGGDPVVGQLGTYSWAGGGSASPWLPGAPIAVGAEEPLIVTVAPAVRRHGLDGAQARPGRRTHGRCARPSSPPRAIGPPVLSARARVVDPGRDGHLRRARVRRPTPGGWTCPDRPARGDRQAVVTAGSGEAEKIETWASSGSITPRTFWRVRRWTHEDQLSK